MFETTKCKQLIVKLELYYFHHEIVLLVLLGLRNMIGITRCLLCLAECYSEADCSGTHTCVNHMCVPACPADGSSCGTGAVCYGVHHRAVCQCQPGLTGDANIACIAVGCRSDSECPSDRACINNLCTSPCAESNPCQQPAECTVYDHKVDCSCPPGYVGDVTRGCEKSNYLLTSNVCVIFLK